MSTSGKLKKQPKEDWHKADIKAALEKKGWSLSQLSIHNEYSRGALKIALYRPWPKAERIIASAIGIKPEQIWPSRYPLKECRNPKNTPHKQVKPAKREAA